MFEKFNHEPIEGKRVRLRLLEDKDVELIRFWRNEPHIKKWFQNDSVIEAPQHFAWYEKYKTLNNDYLYIIEMLDSSSQAIGQLGIYNINWQNKEAEYGRVLARSTSFNGKGLFYEASFLLFEFWKNTFGITNYFIRVKIDNLRATHLYTLLGFKMEAESDGYLFMRLQFSSNSQPAGHIKTTLNNCHEILNKQVI